MENCKTCRFWNFGREHPGFGLGRLLADHCISDCRHHSPVAKDYWAKTRGDDGCGDHEFVPDLTPCCLCGESIGPPPRHFSYASEPTCKACAEKEDARMKAAMMPANLAARITRKKLRPGAKCLLCGKIYEGEEDWLHLSASGDDHHYCPSCRLDKV